MAAASSAGRAFAQSYSFVPKDQGSPLSLGLWLEGFRPLPVDRLGHGLLLSHQTDSPKRNPAVDNEDNVHNLRPRNGRDFAAATGDAPAGVDAHARLAPRVPPA